MADLSRKRDRERLPARREPHWQRLAEGAYLGFRRGPDTWLARFRDRSGKQQYKPLGEAIEYDDAKERAEEWLASIKGSGVRTVRRDTVRAALETYLADLRRHNRPDTASEAGERFKRIVYTDPLAELELESATLDDFLEWRDRIRVGRAARTTNRSVRAVKAGLNRARQLGHLGNSDAWDLQALPDDEGQKGTAVFLNPEQRVMLIVAANPSLADFLRGLELTGARPKELASARVEDFDGETLRLSHRKGKPARLRIRQVVLSIEGAAFFERMAKDKLPKALLFTEDGEQGWRRHMWARGIRAAVKTHNEKPEVKKSKSIKRLPLDASAYAFRHARISELLQVHSVDPLTVAAQTGTSVAMIEMAYLRFIPSAMQEKLRNLKVVT